MALIRCNWQVSPPAACHVSVARSTPSGNELSSDTVGNLPRVLRAEGWRCPTTAFHVSAPHSPLSGGELPSSGAAIGGLSRVVSGEGWRQSTAMMRRCVSHPASSCRHLSSCEASSAATSCCAPQLPRFSKSAGDWQGPKSAGDWHGSKEGRRSVDRMRMVGGVTAGLLRPSRARSLSAAARQAGKRKVAAAAVPRGWQGRQIADGQRAASRPTTWQSDAPRDKRLVPPSALYGGATAGNEGGEEEGEEGEEDLGSEEGDDADRDRGAQPSAADMAKFRQKIERNFSSERTTFGGNDLASLIRAKYGKSYDVQLVRRKFMGKNLLALHVMWLYREHTAFPLTEEEYIERLDEVAAVLREMGAVGHVKQSLEKTRERPRVGKAVNIFIDPGGAGARADEFMI
ncbi:hypothetical protein CBR_g48375 [Chara braunii]|uniref:Uncharacterized protein n=1 Tax=Chara braunii TaxID=69332 RepID=A0A388K4G9_CHABU|nr:hypothetical protein CBR_g48375 [Chara braunii]|eukprot:GBG64909.1 hypothetical protein CBR_g48375 [Chara braunii]